MLQGERLHYLRELMVKLVDPYPRLADGEVNADAWLVRLLSDYPQLNKEVLQKTLQILPAPIQEKSLHLADLLADLRLDADTLAVALIYYPLHLGQIKSEDIHKNLSPTIMQLADSVNRLGAVQVFSKKTDVEKLRKMLLAMVEDIRVVIIKLAERVCALRDLKDEPPEIQQQVAYEAMNLYAPLANRLGVGQLKWRLEDMAFRYLEPDAYKEIAKELKDRRDDREQYLQTVIEQVKESLHKLDIEAHVAGRVKHIYSIWRKMQQKSRSYAQIYDVRAVRLLVPRVQDCYAALGVVHGQWQHIPKEFDDYIATPKANGYRSLHTAVMGPNGKTLEIQIRTNDMHREAEYGVAAHWRYKETSEGTALDAKKNYEAKIAWLRQLLDSQSDLLEGEEWVHLLKTEGLDDKIYVFTPTGDIVDLPQGSTSLDFAYRIHTEIGHRCRGAKVNGHIAPLTHILHTGDKIEILTTREGGPSRDWLNPNMGYLKTPRSRAKVHQWFRQQDYDENLSDGRQILERELQRLGLSDVDHSLVARKLNYKKEEDMLAGLGRGDVKTSALVHVLQELFEPPSKQTPSPWHVPVVAPRKSKSSSDVVVEGVGSLVTQFAQCCRPVPGDAIIGYVSQQHVVAIHREDCPNVQRLDAQHHERLLPVSWTSTSKQTYPVAVDIQAFDRPGLLRDITGVLANEKINVIGLTTQVSSKNLQAHVALTIEIASLESLGRVLDQISQIDNVFDVRRVRAK